MAEEGDGGTTGGSENILNNGNDLLLYNYPSSYCAQKVVFALHEKKLPFKNCVVDIIKGEQFEPWFMKLNPDAMVPVLKDNVKVIPDSARIIDYLEDNFSNGDTPRLMPEKGTEEAQKMKEMNLLLDSVPFEILTFGCFSYPELTLNMKIRDPKSLVAKYPAHIQLLDEYIGKYPSHADNYRKRKEVLQNTYARVQDINQVKKAITDVEEILDKIETELASRSNEKVSWWLCAEKFTIADISFAVLLHRIVELGLWEQYFKGKHPFIADFFKRVQQREAFKKTINPGLFSLICCGCEQKTLIAISGIVVVLGFLIVAGVLYRRNK